MMTNSSRNPVKMIARATDFAYRKRQQAAAAGKPSAMVAFGRIIAVARLLAELTDGKDQFVVAAGLLLDIVEDTDCQVSEIERRFGKEVARLLTELGWDRDGTDAAQARQIELALAAGRSQRAKMIVMADHAQAVETLQLPDCNLEAIEQRIERLTWSARIVKACRGAHPPLGDVFDRAYTHALDKTNNVLAGLAGPEADLLRSKVGDAYRIMA